MDLVPLACEDAVPFDFSNINFTFLLNVHLHFVLQRHYRQFHTQDSVQFKSSLESDITSPFNILEGEVNSPY